MENNSIISVSLTLKEPGSVPVGGQKHEQGYKEVWQ